MTPETYSRIRAEIGTQAEVAKRLGLTRNILAKRELKGPITEEAAIAISVLRLGGVVLATPPADPRPVANQSPAAAPPPATSGAATLDDWRIIGIKPTTSWSDFKAAAKAAQFAANPKLSATGSEAAFERVQAAYMYILKTHFPTHIE